MLAHRGYDAENSDQTHTVLQQKCLMLMLQCNAMHLQPCDNIPHRIINRCEVFWHLMRLKAMDSLFKLNLVDVMNP